MSDTNLKYENLMGKKVKWQYGKHPEDTGVVERVRWSELEQIELATIRLSPEWSEIVPCSMLTVID